MEENLRSCEIRKEREVEFKEKYIVAKLADRTTESCAYEIIWNANLMQEGNFIDVFLARHVSGTYAHRPEH